MNKVYKVIWNHSLNTFVVVSELARGYVKSSSSSNSSTSKLSKVFKLNLLGLLLAISLPSQAYIAIDSVENGRIGFASADARPQNPAVDGGTYPLDYKNPGNKSYDNKDISIGGNNYSPRTSSGIAIGKYSSAIASRADRRSNGIAIGDYSKATGGLSMALGSFSLAGNVGSIALGTASRADGFNALSMMRQSAAIGDYSTAIGSVSWANGTASFALGASATAFGDQSIAIGSVSPTTSASASNSKKTKYDGLNRTQTNGNNSIAMGSAARTNGENSFAIGSGAETGEFIEKRDTYLEDMVREADVNKKAKGAMAFGVNAKAKEAKAIAFGEEAKALKENSMAFGAQANASEQNAIAFGALANATNSSAMAFGSKANALKQNAMAFGANAQATQQNAMAFGTNAKATVTKAIAIGFNTNATQNNAVAIGSETNATQSNTTAIGTTAKASQANSTALGFGAQATHENSVALGANSKTDNAVATANSQINGVNHQFAGNNPIGTVSIGDTNKERTITNVGAGRISSTSTDAINGSQLHAVITEVNKGWNITTAAAGGEVSGNNNPAKVKLGDTVTVTAGKNIKITQADKNITVATKDNVTFKKVDAETLNVTGDTTVKNLTATGDTKVKNFTVDPSSNINMGNNRIMNVGDPTEATDAVNKKYVDNVEFNYKGDSGTGKNKLSTQTAFKGTANEIVTAATNGSVTFSLAKEVKDSLVLAKSAVQNFTVGVGSTASSISIDKTNKHFDIVGGSNYVTTTITDRKVKIDLSDNIKNVINDVTNNLITVTGGATQANSFKISNGGSVKVISNPNDATNIITVGADTNQKAITVGVNSESLNTFITNNPQVQANKNKIAALEPKVESNTNRINALEPRVQNTEKEITALKPQVTNNKNEIDALKPQVTNNKNEIDALKPQVETNKQDIADLKPQVESNKAEIDTLKPKVDKNTADIAAGWELQANGTKIKDVNPNDRIANFTQGQNIEISVENNSIKVSTSLTPKFTNATFGDNSDKTVIDKDGITITNNGKSPVKLNDNGLDNGGNKIQNLANGTSPNDAVNMSQLDAVNATANSGWKLQVNKEPDSESKVTPNATVSLNNDDGNIQITKTKNDNNVTFALNTTLTLGKNGADQTGKDGSLTVTGKDGSSVVLNGKDGSIGLTGTAGANGLKPQTTIKVTKGQPDVNNTGNKTRITYTNGNNDNVEEVATLHDGLKFQGDDKSPIAKQLNQTLDIVGGAQGPVSDNNIAVRTSTDKTKLEIKLAKSLTNLTSIEVGSGNDKTNIDKDGIRIINADPTKNVSLTDTGLNNGGHKIENIANGTNSGDAVNFSQLDAVSKVANAGWVLFTNNQDNTKSVIKPNATVSLNNNDGNIHITKTKDDGNVTFALNHNITLGKAGNGNDNHDGALTVQGKNGSSVVLNGSDGSISLTGTPGTPNTKIKVGSGAGGVEDTNSIHKNRITYTNGNNNEETVATLNDGLKFKGDDTTVINKKLNQQLEIVGGAENSKLSDRNIGVNSNNGKLEIKLSKELNELTSTTFGSGADKTFINKDGITIHATAPNKNVSLTESGLNNGNNQITNVASGLGKGKTLSTLQVNDGDLTNAANIGDLKNAIDNITKSTADGGFGFIDSDNNAVKQDLGTTIKVQAKDGISAKVVNTNDGKKALEFGLNSTVSIGNNAEPGQITIKGENGQDGITLNGKDGTIGLKGKNGVSANITVGNGPNTLDSQTNNTTPRISYTNGSKTEYVATTSDGLIFGANTGVDHKAKLNTKIEIKGASTNQNWDAFDSGTNLMTKVDTDNHLITIALSKNLKDLVSATFSNGVNPTVKSELTGHGLTITPTVQGKSPVKLTDSGLDNGDNQITNVKSGLNGVNLNDAQGNTLKNAVNVEDLKNAINNTVGQSGWNLKVNGGTSVKVGHDNTVEFINGDNINITNNDKNITIATSKNLSVDTLKAGKKGENGQQGVDGNVTAEGKNGSSVILNGGNGSISVSNKGVNGADANITVKQGHPDVDGADGSHKARIVYTPVNGQPEEVATLKDGLKFIGDKGGALVKHLNDTVTIKGNLSETAEVTDKNLRVDNDNGSLILKMATSLQELKEATFGKDTDKSVLNKDGLTITNGNDTNKTVSLTDTGLNNGGNQIKNVSSGLSNGKTLSTLQDGDEDLKNAANISDLKNAVNDLTKAGTLGGFGLSDQNGDEVKEDLGKSIKVKGDESIVTKVNTAEKSLEISLNNKITVGDATNPGSVTIKGNNDKDAIALNGQDGTIKLKDANGGDRVSLNGNDGSIGLTGKDGVNGTLTFAKGDSHIDGTVGTKETTRISYTPNGSTTPEFVATLNDGLKFGANTGPVRNAKLNSQIDVKGAETNTEWAKFDAGKNIMTSINGGTITVGLAKALTDLESVTFNKDKNGGTPTATTKIDSNGLTITPTGNNVPDKTVSLTDKGLNNGGNTITNIASGLTKADGSKSELKDATGDVLNNAANIGDLKSALTNLTDNGFGLKDQDGKEFKHKLGETAQIKGDGSVVTKVVTNDDSSKALQIGLNKDITVGNAKDPGSVTVKGSNDKDSIKLDGTAGKITVKKDDGKDAVSLNKDGTIGIDGADGASASLTMKKGPADLEGKNANEQNPRLSYTPNGSKTPEFVATLNDGLKFGANTGTVRNAKLNSQIDVKGDVKNTDWNKFDAGKNIMTNINDGTITVGLAKALTDLESITFNKNTNGNPTATAKIDSNGLTITPNGNNVLDKTVSLTDKGLNNGGNKITNIAAGDVSENSKDAVNGSQLYEVKETANAGWNLSVNEDKANNSSNVKPKQTVELNNSDGNIVITKTEDNGKHKVDFKLGDTLTVGPKDATGKPTEGAVVIGKDGRDGKNNENTIALVGKDGKDAVSIKGKDGVGTIGLTGAAGNDGTNTSAELSIAEGEKGLENNDRGDKKTRIVYKSPTGDKEEVATLNDGLMFAGNDEKLINRKLNTRLNILGGIVDKETLKMDSTSVSSNNLGVRWKSDDSLEIVMKERPTFSGLVLNGKDGQPAKIDFKDANGTQGMSISGSNGKNGDPSLVIKNKDGQDGVTFTNDGRITNVADGKEGKDAVNMSQLNKVKDDLVNKGFALKAEDNGIVNKPLGEAIEVVGADSNISTKVADGKVKIELAKKLDLGDAGSVKMGDTTVNNEGVKVGDKVKLTKDGLKVGDKVNITESGVKVGDVNITDAGIDAGSKKVTNVADGDISANSKDAVNGSQLFKEAAKAKTEVEAGENIVVTPRDGDNGQKIYTVATKKDVSFDNVKVGDIAINKDSGINAGDKKITNVANGEIGKGSKDAVNGDQLFTEAAKAKSEVKAGTNVASVTTGTGDKGQTIYTVNADGASVSAGSDKVTVTKGTKDTNNVTDYKVDLAQATKDDIAKGVDAKAQVDKGINFAGDDGKSTNYKLGDTVTISGDSNLTTETTDKGVTVKLNKDINLNSVSANTFKAGGVTISADSGINAGGKQITHVASGLVDKNGNKIHIRNAAGDTLNNAVNVGDLKTVAGDIYNNIDTTNKRVDKLDKRVRGIGANSAAAASLPQVYIPGKSMVAASAGGYGGEAAVALGYSRASDNGKVILKLTGTANSAGHYSGGVGVGYQW
ncbi:YadA-like family protein [Pasteurella dagmatis]|uniref:Hep/Hag repeat protein n=1 Tax=Pasteurella dagmatis ATCC 43325 TaxID=667128 RepID=C9PQQ8_9PAST|nr:YadA-like family protein [Pasteurella dagmatis]EEX50180.1 Hep/Hag repeat protein [Pasteurella dagmatis ATCC 43325]SNV58338.1 autotransporter adhesin [Pasteurella dagmatis]